jgi:hypothetical protein
MIVRALALLPSFALGCGFVLLVCGPFWSR